jgi:adenosylhomocysteine nucleosidase
MEDVVVFAALPWEARAVLPGLSAPERLGTTEWRGHLGDGATCRVLTTGVGAALAAAAAERVPAGRLAVVVGCAGAATPDLRAGDLVVGAAIAAIGASEPSSHPAQGADAMLAALAAHGLQARAGTIGTVATLADTPAAKTAAAAAGALAIEMESAAIATTLRRRGGMVSALRVVLDEADQELPFGVLRVDASGRVSPLRVVTTLAGRPDLWPAFARLARQRRLAERRLREAMAALCGAGLDGFGLPLVASAEAAVG